MSHRTFLENVRARTAMHTTAETWRELRAYLEGYDAATSVLGARFAAWLHQHHGTPANLGWPQAIQLVVGYVDEPRSADERQRMLAYMFELVDEYLAAYPEPTA